MNIFSCEFIRMKKNTSVSVYVYEQIFYQIVILLQDTNIQTTKKKKEKVRRVDSVNY